MLTYVAVFAMFVKFYVEYVHVRMLPLLSLIKRGFVWLGRKKVKVPLRKTKFVPSTIIDIEAQEYRAEPVGEAPSEERLELIIE